MKDVSLSEIVEINPRYQGNGTVDPSALVSFVPMASVGEDGSLNVREKRPISQVKKGFTYFENGDVLVAKITPCFENGKATMVNNLESKIGFGSTEFHVLRPSKQIDQKYLFYAVWNPKFREIGADRMTGSAGQKRVPTDFLRNFKIPLPEISEQRRIATILEKADAIRRKRCRVIELMNDFLRSVFSEIFGDEEKQGPYIPFHDAVEIISGQVDPRVSPYSEMLLVGGENIESGTGKLLKLKTAQEGRAISGKYLFSSDCILYSKIRPYLNKVVLPDFSGVCSADIYPIVPKKEFLKEFVAFALQTKRFLAYAESCSTRTSIPKINREDLGKYSFPMPSIAKQSLFSQIFNTAQKCRLSLVQSEQETENCFRALSSNIFQGN